MKTKVLLKISMSLVGVILVLSLIFFFTKMPNEENNGFTREWLANSIKPLDQAITTLPITRISGSTNNHIFFSSEDPSWLIMTDINLKIKDTFRLSIQPTQELLSNNIVVDSPSINIYANNISYLISGRLDTSYVDTVKLHTSLFTRSTPIAPNRLIVRGLDSTQGQQVFKKINSLNGEILQESAIIENQQDGGFTTDGSLQYNISKNQLLYVQIYQNRFFCLDTNLNLIYTGKTIDTTNTNDALIKIVKMDTTTKLMPATPRQMVNLTSYTDNDFLYVSSNLRADNEKIADFRSNTVIDVYLVINGHYIGSFYIPNFENKKVTKILVSNNLLVALYKGGNIATFQLNIPSIKPLTLSTIQ